MYHLLNSCECEDCNGECDVCGGKGVKHKHRKHKNPPKKHEKSHYEEDGNFPKRIWPTGEKKKGPRF